MKIVFIKDEITNTVFGFIKEFPAICSQGNTEEEVETKIVSYFKALQ